MTTRRKKPAVVVQHRIRTITRENQRPPKPPCHRDAVAFRRPSGNWYCGKCKRNFARESLELLAKTQATGADKLFHGEPTNTVSAELSPLAEDARELSPRELLQNLLVELYAKQDLPDSEIDRRTQLGLRLLGFGRDGRLDPINKREHYNHTKMEVIEIIDDHDLDFYRGSVVKYLLRAPYTADVLEQFKKGQYCLNRLVRLTENHQGPFGLQALQQRRVVPNG